MVIRPHFGDHMTKDVNKASETEPLDFATYVFNHARACEQRGDRRAAMKSYAHAWRASASAENQILPSIARSEMLSMAQLINDTIFSTALYRDLISTFTIQHRNMAAWAHHDLGKIFRNAWQHGEIVNPGDAIKHFVAARDEFIEIWEARSAALVEMDLAHIYMEINKIDQAVALLESARATWQSLDEPGGAGECALSLGDCFTLLGKNNEAVNVYQLAVEDFDKAGNDQAMNSALEKVSSPETVKSEN